MKKNTATITAAIACVLVAICFIQIGSMRQELTSLRNDLSSQLGFIQSNIQSLSSRIQNLTSDIQIKLEEQASIISSSDYAFGTPDIDARTVVVQFSVTPKIYDPAQTAARLVCNGETYPMLLADGNFQADIELPLFAVSEVSTVFFEENGTVRSQALDWEISPQSEYFPMVYAQYGFTETGRTIDDAYICSRKGLVMVTVVSKALGIDIREMSLLEILNGQEIKQTAVDLSQEAQDSYAASFDEGSSAPDLHLKYESGSSLLYYFIDNDWTVLGGNMLELVIELVDSNGLRYRCKIDEITVDETGQLQTEGYPYWGDTSADIYDSNGQVLYESESVKYG